MKDPITSGAISALFLFVGIAAGSQLHKINQTLPTAPPALVVSISGPQGPVSMNCFMAASPMKENENASK